MKRRRPKIETTVDGGVPDHLHVSFGHRGWQTGAGKHDPRPNRARTRSTAEQKAIRDTLD